MIYVSLVTLSMGLLAVAQPLRRALPAPVDVATAKIYLSELTVAVDSNVPAYARDLFKTWDIISGNCNTREVVLIRDGTNVVTDSTCSVVSGNWVSPYDGLPTTLSSSLDIDHLVPLKEAWVSGARNWTPAQREAFANDLTRPQLVAITNTVNESKGDRDPALWMPPLASFYCEYIQAWITVKQFYSLTIDSAEQAALTTFINQC
ncbi:hypothetical protein B0F90DRAFT_767119 [Multifurca ochricompacta]|uniref:GmrSD restriction endonucleases C-terminal domain-containing protein n=1 Tax=Multifurca ochricompacta TaxID=376703 RepID=A0AAD4MCE2_9AGAM|nr:hypothetical protein B0F90DRAFT_767119 [Multifurca ochricompacta]